MNCPNCKSEMEKGISDGGWWRGEGFSSEVKEIFGKNLAGALSVSAYRCPACGKVEFTTEVEK